MAVDISGYALDVSEELFRLTTQCIALYSNDTLRHQTLTNLVNERAAAADLMASLTAAGVSMHLGSVPTRGRIRLHLNIQRQSAEKLNIEKERFSTETGRRLTLADMLSVILQDYLARAALKGISH